MGPFCGLADTPPARHSDQIRKIGAARSAEQVRSSCARAPSAAASARRPSRRACWASSSRTRAAPPRNPGLMNSCSIRLVMLASKGGAVPDTPPACASSRSQPPAARPIAARHPSPSFGGWRGMKSNTLVVGRPIDGARAARASRRAEAQPPALHLLLRVAAAALTVPALVLALAVAAHGVTATAALPTDRGRPRFGGRGSDRQQHRHGGRRHRRKAAAPLQERATSALLVRVLLARSVHRQAFIHVLPHADTARMPC